MTTATSCASSSSRSSTAGARTCRSTAPSRTSRTDAINRPPPNVPYTPWHLLEHIRIAQTDILDYIRNRDYLAPTWPEEYWPARGRHCDAGAVRADDRGIPADRAALHDLVADPADRPAGDDPEHARAHHPARGAPGRRPQRLPRRRVRDPPPGHGDLAARPAAVAAGPWVPPSRRAPRWRRSRWSRRCSALPAARPPPFRHLLRAARCRPVPRRASSRPRPPPPHLRPSQLLRPCPGATAGAASSVGASTCPGTTRTRSARSCDSP